MLRYRKGLKSNARDLRSKLTEAEQILWSRLRMKQLLGVQFNLQRPIGNYIVDFYAARAKLVVEVDGSGHLSSSGKKRDKKRDDYLGSLGLLVLRFDDAEVLRDTEGVLELIFRKLSERLNPEIPPIPPFLKGGKRG
jgi:very-short-patch-repair endonuclease